jgi:lantibiotic modifying enzyme
MKLIAGFEEMYTYLLQCRDNLLSNQEILSMFDDLEPRILLRGTATYTGLQLRLLHPEFMANGIDRSIELEWLARPSSGLISHSCDRRRIYDHEREAMEKLDVPAFTSSFADLVSDDGIDPDLSFLRARRDSSFVRERLAQLGVADCSRQVEIIKQAIRDRFKTPV